MKFSDSDFLRVTLLIAAGVMGCGEKEPDSASPSEPQATSDPWSCEDPVDILQADGKTPSGFVQCPDGVMDRVSAVTCTTPMQGDSPQCLDPDNVISAEPLAKCRKIHGTDASTLGRPPATPHVQSSTQICQRLGSDKKP